MNHRRRLAHLARFAVFTITVLALMLAPGGPWSPTAERVAAQDDPAAAIAALAQRVHVQNIRAQNYTFWIGGNLGNPNQAPSVSVLGDALTGFELAGLNGDPAFAFSDVERPTLLNFWASWCPPCRVEFPHLVSVALAPDDHAFDIVFVNMSDLVDAALLYLENHPDEIHTVVDENDRLARRAQVEAIPTSVLLDTDGTALAVHVGVMTGTVTDFFDLVAANPGTGGYVAEPVGEVDLAAEIAPFDAADAVAIADGETVRGTLTHDAFQLVYVFEGAAGENAVIRMASDHIAASGVDPYLVLIGPDGERLAENDDSALITGINSEIRYQLPADGRYTIVATRFLERDGIGTGDYDLSLLLLTDEELAALDAEPEPLAEGTIAYGRETTGRLGGEQSAQAFTFEGAAGDVVALTVDTMPAYLPVRITLLAPDESVVAESDDSRGGTAQLTGAALPADGTYTVVVARDPDAGVIYSDFTLRLEAESLAAPADDPATDAVDVPADGDADATTDPGSGAGQPQDGAQPIAYGETVTGTLDDDVYEQRWTFDGAAGDVVTIDMRQVEEVPGGLDGYLLLLGPDGATLAEVDDAGSVMPRIDNFELPADGTYTIVATRFGFANGFSSGDYTLTLTAISVAASDGAASGGADSAADGATGIRWIDPAELPAGTRFVAYGESVSGTLDADDFDDWYILRGHAGDVVTIRMTTPDSDLDAYLFLLDGAGYELARNDDSGAGASTDAAIADFTLPDDGTYVVRATRYGLGNGLSSGAYTLSIESDAEPVTLGASEIRALSLGEIATGTLDFDTPGAQYTFEGTAGQQVTVGIQRTEGTLDPSLALLGPDGDTLATNSQWRDPSEARLSNVTLPVDGTYTLDVALEDLSTAGSYELIVLVSEAAPLDPGAFVPTPDLDLELVVIWNAAADLNLSASVPPGGAAGEAVERGADFCADPAPVSTERLVWEPDRAAPGLYTVTVTYELNCAASSAPVSFIIAVARDGELVAFSGGTLARPGDSYSTLVQVAP